MSRLRRITFRREAKDDLIRLAEQDQNLVRQAIRTIIEVDAGRLPVKSLRHMAKTGDLTDCGRVYFGRDGASHRIVFRHTGQYVEVLEILEVVAVEERADDLAYLAAGLRLRRLDDNPVRRSDAGRKLHRSRRRDRE